MGSHATAIVAFGVDLGGLDGEWNFEPADEVEDFRDDPDLDALISEFGGWDEVALPWGETGSTECAARVNQYRRELATQRATGIQRDSYGYEYEGNYLHIGTEQRTSYDCVVLDTLLKPAFVTIERLAEFLTFLDGKGLRLKPGYREPNWLLMATYG